MAKLTKAEKEVIDLLENEKLTKKQILIRRGCTRQALNKLIRKIKQKGLYSEQKKKVSKIGTAWKPRKPIRVHGQKFKLTIIFKDSRYIKLMEKNNLIYVDSNTVKLYKNAVIVYGTQSFEAETVDKAIAKSLAYYQKLFYTLENDLKIILMKPRKHNIKMYDCHVSEMNNELAEDCNNKAEKIRVYTSDQGKLWFMIDNSFNINEAETLGATAAPDMQDIVRPFFNDLRDNEAVTMTMIKQSILALANENKETAAGLASVVKLITPNTIQETKEKEHNKTDYIL